MSPETDPEVDPEMDPEMDAEPRGAVARDTEVTRADG